MSTWPVDEWVRLSPENIDEPRVSRLASRVEALFERHWVDQGLASECSVRERIERDDIVLVAVGAQGGDDPTPHGAIFGRLSDSDQPSFAELGCDEGQPPHNLNFYAVVVDDAFRGRSVGVKLLVAASRAFTAFMPTLDVQTMSPLAGFRAYVAWQVGAPLRPLGRELTATTRSVARTLEYSTTRPSLDELLNGTPFVPRFHSAFGMSPRAWLRDICLDPRAALEDWNRLDTEGRELQRALLARLATDYATATWALPPGRSDPSMACYVSHFHRRNGAKFEYVRPFSRLDDPENLYSTATFRYPTLNPTAERDNYHSFRQAQDHALCRAAGDR